ncbi:hypothetical protein HDV00_000880 [Rhizophlyctis rosea]|nr:hypothetical protein HDV00_000880 [Rhizophlyctis rosea]
MLSAAPVLGGGRTYLAIGFVDFSSLLVGEFRLDAGPVHFVGVDMCPYVVAKTAIITTMLELGSNSESIVQVWASSTWNQRTSDSFRDALTILVVDEAMAPVVRHILQHWKNTSPMTVRTAYQKWLERQRTDKSTKLFANLTRVEDRIQTARYEVTGEFIGNNHAVTANITMFSPLPNASPVTDNENLFFMLPMQELLMKRQMDSFVSAAWKFMVDKGEQLKSMIQEGQLTVKLILGQPDWSNQKLLKELKAFEPATLFWNNVVDYMTPAEHHRIARFISVDDTIHTGYTMNW